MRSLFVYLLISIVLYSCSQATDAPKLAILNNQLLYQIDSLAALRRQRAVDYDIEDILSDKKLTVLMENNTVSFFIYRGKNMGYEYEVLNQFAKHLGVELEVIVVQDFNDVMSRLNDGEAELIAGHFTVTEERKKVIDFTDPFLHTKQVLVQRIPEISDDTASVKLINSIEQMNEINIHTFEESSFNEQLLKLKDSMQLGFNIVYDTGFFDLEELIRKVSIGEIDYTVSDYTVAKVNKKFYDNIDIEFGTTTETPIAFGVRKSSPGLKEAFNKWMEDVKNTKSFAYLKTKYFRISQYVNKREGKYSNLGGGEISPYDAIIKREAAKGIIDWRLVAALMYQESRFNPNCTSWAGAFGLMQFMPETGKVYGVYPDSPSSVQIAGGVRKLNRNYKDWLEAVPDSAEALKFTLASYNAGKGHVEDAQRLAEKYGKDPNVWKQNVEEYLLLLRKSHYYRDEVVKFGYCRGSEPVRYVNKIMFRYETYKAAFPDEN